VESPGSYTTHGKTQFFSDAARARVHREKLEALILDVDGPAFARARTEGHLLSIAEAAGLQINIAQAGRCAAERK
jgi:hypothetical protein